MKKIITLALILAFCSQMLLTPTVFAVSSPDRVAKKKVNTQNVSPVVQLNGIQQYEQYKKYEQSNKSGTSEIYLDAFENKYQNTNLKQNNKNTLNGEEEEELSAVEKIFNDKKYEIDGKALRQVGYDLFTPISSGSGTTGKFDNSYKLNIGEKVNIYLYGDSVDVMAISGTNLLSPMTKAEVDSTGNIFIQGVGILHAEGKSIHEVETEINRMASKKYKNTQAKVTISSGQEFSVFVYGQVNKPGKVFVGNNSSVMDALNAAGGVKKTGTLRNITYTTNKQSRGVDLYSAIFSGDDNGIILRPNDKIFVGKVGSVVAIRNGIVVPGIYETKTGESLQRLISFTGGILPHTELHELTLTGFDEKTKERVAKNIEWNQAKTIQLHNGDDIEFRELYNVAENIVTLQGNVKHPATYTYRKGMRLSDVLKNENELLEETFISQAVIRRISGKNNQIETIPVFLKEFFAGMSDPVLQPKDVINIFRNTNSQFVDVYGCINIPKHLPYVEGMKLYDLMTDIQFVESDISNVDNPEDIEEMNKVLVNYKKNQDTLEIGTENLNQLVPTENVAVEITDSEGETTIYYLYDIMINSDRIKSIAINADDKVLFRTLRDNEIVKSVKISGFVNRPGVYKFVEGRHLADMITFAGGLSKDADLRGTVFKRTNLQYKQVALAKKNNERDIQLLEGRIASGFKQTESDQKTKLEMIDMLKNDNSDLGNKYTGQIALDIKSNDLTKIRKIDNVELQDGDDIYIPRMSNHISVIGEVYNEQAFVYRNGTTASDYIKLVGGYTPNASRHRIYKVGVNGRAQKIHGSTRVVAGDTIVIPRKIVSNDWIAPMAAVTSALQSLASLAVMGFAITKW